MLQVPMYCSRIIKGSLLRSTSLSSAEDARDLAQVTLDPCARKNANAGSHGIGVFNPNGSSYANADVPGTIKGS